MELREVNMEDDIENPIRNIVDYSWYKKRFQCLRVLFDD